MMQILYISTRSARYMEGDVAKILTLSRLNNAAEGITGMLLFNGRRFLQALEGDGFAVGRLFERIRTDPRHMAVVELARREITAREFGDWAMASDQGGDAGRADFLDKVERLTANASPTMRAHFQSYAALKAA